MLFFRKLKQIIYILLNRGFTWYVVDIVIYVLDSFRTKNGEYGKRGDMTKDCGNPIRQERKLKIMVKL